MTSLRTEAREELKAYIERIERIAEERKALGDDQRALFAEAKAKGYDTKSMRRIIKRRQKESAEIAEWDAIDGTYMHALGMAAESPLHEQISALVHDEMGRDQLIDALQKLVPVNGEIIARLGGKPMRLWRTEDGKSFAEEYVAPKPEKTGRAIKSSATVLSIVPKDDPVKAAADRAERRSRDHARDPDEVDEDDEEPVA
jgi:uncharacterized protein (UPF0335 family)